MTRGVIPRDYRIDIKLLKYELHNVLHARDKTYWKRYWAALQQFITTKLSRQEFQAVVEDLVGQEYVSLHNAFISAIFHNVNTLKLPRNYRTYLPYESNNLSRASPPLANENMNSLNPGVLTLKKSDPIPVTIPKKSFERNKFQRKDRSVTIMNHHQPSSPLSLKRKRLPLKMSLLADTNEQAIRRLLEITRSKVMRSRCKTAEQSSSAVLSMVTKLISRRSHSQKITTKVFNVPSTPWPPQSPSTSLKTPLCPSKNKIQLKAAHEVQYPVNGLSTPASFQSPFACPEVLPGFESIQALVQAIGVEAGLKGVSASAVTMLEASLQNYIMSLLTACTEAACEAHLIPFKRPRWGFSSMPVSNASNGGGKKKIKSVATSVMAIKTFDNPAMSWPKNSPWALADSETLYPSSGSSPAGSSSYPNTAMPKNNGSKNIESSQASANIFITLSHLREAIINYPGISRANQTIHLERVTNRIKNSY